MLRYLLVSVIGCGISTLVVAETVQKSTKSTLGEEVTATAAKEAVSLAQLIKQLGHEDFRKREWAEKALRKLGRKAHPGLRAVKVDDQEVRMRIRRILLLGWRMEEMATYSEAQDLFDKTMKVWILDSLNVKETFLIRARTILERCGELARSGEHHGRLGRGYLALAIKFVRSAQRLEKRRHQKNLRIAIPLLRRALEAFETYRRLCPKAQDIDKVEEQASRCMYSAMNRLKL